jgi:hypothetical protein
VAGKQNRNNSHNARMDLSTGMKARPMLESLVKKDIAKRLAPAMVQFIPKRDGPTFEAKFGPETGWDLIDTKTKARFDQPMRWAQKCKETMDKRFEGKGISVKAFIFYRGKSLKTYEKEINESEGKHSQQAEEDIGNQRSKQSGISNSEPDARSTRGRGRKAQDEQEKSGVRDGSSRKRSIGSTPTSKTKEESSAGETECRTRRRSLQQIHSPKSTGLASNVRSESSRTDPRRHPGPQRTTRLAFKVSLSASKASLSAFKLSGGRLPPSNRRPSLPDRPLAAHTNGKSRGNAPPSSLKRSLDRDSQSKGPEKAASPTVSAVAAASDRPSARKRERHSEDRPVTSTARASPSPPQERKKMRAASDAAAGDLNQVAHVLPSCNRTSTRPSSVLVMRTS